MQVLQQLLDINPFGIFDIRLYRSICVAHAIYKVSYMGFISYRAALKRHIETA